MRWNLGDIFRTPELRDRILFTLGMLAAYRLGIFIPAPGVDRIALATSFKEKSGTLFGLYDMFSGGAFSQFSVFMLGIMPYISASIIMQLLTTTVPQLERLSKEGQAGRNKITQYTRYLTIVIALTQGYIAAQGLEALKAGAQDVVLEPGLWFRFMTMMTMAAGSCFVMWLGEQITERGIGNGSSIIITAGIVSRLPAVVYNLVRSDMSPLQIAGFGVFVFVVLAGIVFVERAQRRIPIQYAKRVVGRQIYGGQTAHLPLRINNAGVIPPIFASAVLMFPATLATFSDSAALQQVSAAFAPGAWGYNLTYVLLIVVFAYVYTAVTFNPVDVADNLKRHGGYIPGVRPGRQTAEYLDRILSRLTSAGALYLAAICILPTLLTIQAGTPVPFGGTGLLIVVGVSLDTVAQIESHLLTKHYDGLMGVGTGAQVRGRHRRMLEKSSKG